MEQKINLEEFRKNDISCLMIIISYAKKKIGVPFTYNDYINTTFYLFIEQLKKLENSPFLPMAYNSTLLIIFTSFFAIAEQIISTIYLILYFYCKSDKIPTIEENCKNFRNDYKKTINKIFSEGNLNSTEFKKNKMFNMLDELANARNHILHGNIGEIKVEKTKLPKNPLTINVADIMEELNIIINLINHFRYIFPKLDLMPQILINYKNPKTFLYKYLDLYFYKVIVPYFEKILEKHNLVEERKYTQFLTQLPYIKENVIAKDITVFMKSESKFKKIKMNDEKTDFLNSYIYAIVDPKEVLALAKEQSFQIPCFIDRRK